MGVTVAIHQPNFLPWLGYFRKISRCQTFVFFDNVQMPIGKSFVSRNRIATAHGVLWLTVPVERSGEPRPIAEVGIDGQYRPDKHVRTLETTYPRTSWRDGVLGALVPVLTAGHKSIADLNIALIRVVCRLLELPAVRFERATAMGLQQQGADTIPEILKKTGATIYITSQGKGTSRHLDVDSLKAVGVDVSFMPTQFSPYQQRSPQFEPNLSVVDALFNCGPEKTRAMLDEF